MVTVPEAPISPRELAERQPDTTAEKGGPYGYVTGSANAYWAPDGGVQVVTSEDHDHVVRLESTGVLLRGLPVLTSDEGEVHPRSMSERQDAAASRRRRAPDSEPSDREGEQGQEPYLAPGVPADPPLLLSSLEDTRYGVNSRGHRTLLSVHSTIIGGESRSLVYPNVSPYAAICKIYVTYQATAGGPWLNGGQGTGFLVGPRVMVTSGHMAPGGVAWQIRVIPACWNDQSVYGAGMVTYVSNNWYWNSDSGSDIMICRLWDPIGDTVGWFGTKNYSSSWEDRELWGMAGFPYDINLTHMSRELAIAVRDDDDGDDITVDGRSYDTTQVESDADEASGASGSPLWGDWGGAYAIGVHHGVEYDGTISGTETLSCASGGDGFLAAVNWARRMWG